MGRRRRRPVAACRNLWAVGFFLCCPLKNVAAPPGEETGGAARRPRAVKKQRREGSYDRGRRCALHSGRPRRSTPLRGTNKSAGESVTREILETSTRPLSL